MNTIKQTPLYPQHLEAGARTGPFAGWDMPIQYVGILAEHEWTRSNASVFDICHMGEFELSGPTAFEDLNHLITCTLSTLKIGQCRYGYLLNDQGGVIDDLTVYKFSEDRFMLVVNAGNRDANEQWIRKHLQDTTQFTDRSDSLAKLDVQGPQARKALEAIGGPLPDLGYFRFEELHWLDVDLLISRTGYTGEFGYELYFPAEHAAEIWDKLIETGEIRPAGLGARDTLRLEVGYPLHGHELSLKQTPAGVCKGMFIDQEKTYFGKASLESELAQGSKQILIGLKLEGKRAAREGDRVLLNGTAVGKITSGSYAPSVGCAIALALVDRDAAGCNVTLGIDIRGKEYPADQIDLPFYKNGTARIK